MYGEFLIAMSIVVYGILSGITKIQPFEMSFLAFQILQIPTSWMLGRMGELENPAGTLHLKT